MNNSKKFALAAILATGISGVAGGALADGHMAGLETAPQKLAHAVVIKSVTAEKDGWIAIHALKDGKPVVPGSIGHVYVKAGTTNNVYVPLMDDFEGDTVLAMLHVDDGEMGVYEFGADNTENDKPVVMDGKPVVAPIKIEK